jgi:hypothetical protein
MARNSFAPAVVLVVTMVLSVTAAENTVSLEARVIDADTGRLLPCRVYIRGEDGKWHFPRSVSPEGSALPYKKQSGANSNSVEMHTTLSPHPFAIDLPPGKYTITVEHGKEYFQQARQVTLGSEPLKLTFRLKRWIDMARLGWYSGDTHVHRTLQELPNVQLAEDLNVSFPLLYWVTEAFRPPGSGDKSTRGKIQPEPIFVDDTHVIYPLNTEYEIFTVGAKRHTLGAFFILNHKTVFEKGVPPVAPIAEIAEREGALLELDKHNWPWSMMLVPVMDIDLFELANNHMWRTEFAFSRFGELPPEYMKVRIDARGFTELGWIEYGFQNYYALLNCGFRLRPTAGTASGVHPVPLGFGRVYVKLSGGFDYDAWVRGLDEGRSFVTTGPMLFVQVNGFDPGNTFHQSKQGPVSYSVVGTAQSAHRLQRIEIVVNGRVANTIWPQNEKLASGAYSDKINEKIDIVTSSWIVVRCFAELPGRRIRFAHTGPFHIEVKGRPLRPRRPEIDFLVKRMEKQIARNEAVLSPEAVEEYRRAMRVYKEIPESDLVFHRWGVGEGRSSTD